MKIYPRQKDIPEDVMLLLASIAALPLWKYKLLQQELDAVVEQYLAMERIDPNN